MAKDTHKKLFLREFNVTSAFINAVVKIDVPNWIAPFVEHHRFFVVRFQRFELIHNCSAVLIEPRILLFLTLPRWKTPKDLNLETAKAIEVVFFVPYQSIYRQIVHLYIHLYLTATKVTATTIIITKAVTIVAMTKKNNRKATNSETNYTLWWLHVYVSKKVDCFSYRKRPRCTLRIFLVVPKWNRGWWKFFDKKPLFWRVQF